MDAMHGYCDVMFGEATDMYDIYYYAGECQMLFPSSGFFKLAVASDGFNEVRINKIVNYLADTIEIYLANINDSERYYFDFLDEAKDGSLKKLYYQTFIKKCRGLKFRPIYEDNKELKNKEPLELADIFLNNSECYDDTYDIIVSHYHNVDIENKTKEDFLKVFSYLKDGIKTGFIFDNLIDLDEDLYIYELCFSILSEMFNFDFSYLFNTDNLDFLAINHDFSQDTIEEMIDFIVSCYKGYGLIIDPNETNNIKKTIKIDYDLALRLYYKILKIKFYKIPKIGPTPITVTDGGIYNPRTKKGYVMDYTHGWIASIPDTEPTWVFEYYLDLEPKNQHWDYSDYDLLRDVSNIIHKVSYLKRVFKKSDLSVDAIAKMIDRKINQQINKINKNDRNIKI